MTPRTTYTISGALVGAFWWPIGVPWAKDLTRTFLRMERVEDGTWPSTGTADDALAGPDGRLRDMVDRATDDGDSSNGCRIADGTLTIRRETLRTGPDGRIVGRTVRERIVPLERFPSIEDYLVPEDQWHGWPDAGEDDG